MHDRRPRHIAAALLALSVFPVQIALAQGGLGHLEDATVVPRGLLRLRTAVAWTRYDSRFSGVGVEPLGSSLTSDSLGAQQLTPLAPIENMIGNARGLPFTLSLGASRLDALGREEILPLSLEYGVTDRITFGVTVPVVRKRASVQFRLDSAGANVGPNLHRTSLVARQANIAVQTEFAAAAAQLQSRLAFCEANDSDAGCPELLARRAQAEALIESSESFASIAAALFGSSDSEGQAFVPMGQTIAQLDIAARVADFNSQYRDFLNSGADVITALPVAAAGPAGTGDFQRYLHSDLGRDSLVIQERVGFGDVELGLKALLLDRMPNEFRRLGVQIALRAGVRLPSGSRQSPRDVVDLSLGAGALTIDLQGMADLRFGRAGLLASTFLQSSDATPATMRDRRVVAVHVAPRWHLSGPLAIHGAFTQRDGDATETTRLVGGGVSFMNGNGARALGGRLPIEMRFTHLEAVTGALGQPKYFRDQIEMRFYYRLLNR